MQNLQLWGTDRPDIYTFISCCTHNYNYGRLCIMQASSSLARHGEHGQLVKPADSK